MELGYVTGKHKTSVYWAERAMVPDLGYEPVNASGQVCGFTVCMPEVVDKVDKKRRAEYLQESRSKPHKLPIWC